MTGADHFTLSQGEQKKYTTAPDWSPFFYWLFSIGIVIHVVCIVILASVPPISRDALIHHLAVPKMYLQHGGIYEIPSMHFSYFPMNLDLLYLLPLYFDKAFAAKYVHFVFALLSAGLLYRYLKKTLGRIYGLIGALFFLTLPIIVKLSVTVYVDLGLIYFSWACLYYFLDWHDSQFKFRHLIYSAIFCGLALGTKYNGLILLPIMAALISVGYSLRKNKTVEPANYRQRYRNSFKGIQWGVLFVLVALITYSPWMIRNIIWKQNPVYPLYESVFNPPHNVERNVLQEEKSPPKNAFWMRRHIYKESFAETLSIPIRMFFQGQDDNPRYFDGKLSPFLLLLPLVSLFRLRGSPLAGLKFHQMVLGIFILLFSLFVLFIADFRIRYMAPAIPPLVVLSVFGIQNLVQMVSRCTPPVKKVGWVGISSVVLLVFVINAYYVKNQFAYIQPFMYLSGKVDRDSYITHFRTEYPVIRKANQLLPENARVLCLSIGDRTYYLDREAHLAEDFYTPQDGGFTESLLLNRLLKYETTHIILDKKVLVSWVRSLPKADQLVFEKVFRKNTKLLYEKNDVLLLSLSRRQE